MLKTLRTYLRVDTRVPARRPDLLTPSDPVFPTKADEGDPRIEAWEAELAVREQALRRRERAEATAAPADVQSRLLALQDRERLVQEREAFVEASENRLSERAQRLYEAEAHLEQRRDDLGLELPADESNEAWLVLPHDEDDDQHLRAIA